MFNSLENLAVRRRFVPVYCASAYSSTQAQHDDKAEGDAQAQGICNKPNDRWSDQKAYIPAGSDCCNRRASSLLRGTTSRAQREREHHRKSCANQAKAEKSDWNTGDNESERESYGSHESSQLHHGPWTKTSGKLISHPSAHSHYHGEGSIPSCGESSSRAKGSVEIDGAPVGYCPFPKHHTEGHQAQDKNCTRGTGKRDCRSLCF